MGSESFGLTMQIVESGVWQGIKGFLADYPNMQMRCAEISGDFETIFGEYGDGSHFVDIQLSREISSDKCTLAVRFSLCSYETIDQVFIDFVKQFLSLFNAEVWLMTSAVKLKSYYLPGDSGWLIAALPDEIVEMRRYWQTLFGAKQGAVRVRDSFSFVGVVKNC